MTSNDVYERLGVLEQLVAYLYQQTGVQMPDIRAMAQSQVSDNVKRLLMSGKKMEAIKVYRAETGADLAAAAKVIDSLA